MLLHNSRLACLIDFYRYSMAKSPEITNLRFMSDYNHSDYLRFIDEN